MDNRIAILSIGREILLGHTVDTNAAWMSQTAGKYGYRTTRIMAVDDNEKEIISALRELADLGNSFIFITGGLGPTPDDLTRAAIAKFAGVPLVYHEELWETVQKRFQAFHKTPTESNKVQAYQPRGSVIIENPLGTAPGIDFTMHDVQLFSMPGVPLEMKRMFTDHVVPVLRKNSSAVRYMKQFHICGLGESLAGEIIGQCQPLSPDADIGTCVSDMFCTVRIMAYGETAEKAEARAAAARDALHEKLLPYIYAEDGAGIAEVILQTLQKRGQTLALAESCTGGMIASTLVSCDGASAVLKEGIVCYTNEAKTRLCGVPTELIDNHGAVSEECVRSLAENTCRRAGADYALSISGIAGPTGGTPEKPVGTVWMAVCGPQGTVAKCHHFLADRNGNRTRACNAGLNLLLRHIVQPDS